MPERRDKKAGGKDKKQNIVIVSWSQVSKSSVFTVFLVTSRTNLKLHPSKRTHSNNFKCSDKITRRKGQEITHVLKLS